MGGVGGNFADHFVLANVEANVVDIAHGGVECAQEQLAAAEVDGVAGEGVDDLHERSLDGLLVLDDGDGVKAGVGRSGDAAQHALVEVAEALSAKSWGAATDSGDLDVSADFDGG